MQRNLNNISKVKLNFIGCQCVGEPVKRLLQLGFKIFEDRYDFVNSRLI